MRLVKGNIFLFIIALLCVIQFILQNFTQLDTLQSLLYPPTLSSFFETHKYWQLITPIFVHFNFIHLITNLFLFWYFGKPINHYSRLIFMLLILVSAIISNMAEFLIVDEKFGGISGVNFALFGFIYIYNQIEQNNLFYTSTEINIAVVIFLLLTATDWIGDYAIINHLSGLFVGIVFGYLFAKKDKHLLSQTSPFEKGE